MSTEATIWQECLTKEALLIFIESLDPATTISVIESRGKFYVEEESVFLRSYEKLLYQGRADKIKI